MILASSPCRKICQLSELIDLPTGCSCLFVAWIPLIDKNAYLVYNQNFIHRDFLSNDDVMYVFRIAHKQVMSGRFNFLILVLKDEVDVTTLPAELRLYLSKICS